MKIICLIGRANCGKSTTLKLLYELLKQKAESIIDFSDGNDITVVLTISAKKLAIISAGDTVEDISEHFEEIRKYKPDLIVCAARTSGETRDYVCRQAKATFLIGKPHIELYGHGTNEKFEQCCEKINEQTAQYILTEIHKIFEV